MLSGPQIELHWNNRQGWGAVCRANRWLMSDGRLLEDARRGDCSQWHHKVFAFAELFARQAGRAVQPDDLRKGCYMLALGTPKSLKDFSNADFDRMLVLFKLMIDPDNLRAVMDWQAYETFDQAKLEIARCRQLGVPCVIELPDDPGERRRHMNAIGRMPEAVRTHILRDRFQGRILEDLTLKELRQFTMIVKNRRDYGPRTAINAHTPRFVGEVTADSRYDEANAPW